MSRFQGFSKAMQYLVFSYVILKISIMFYQNDLSLIRNQSVFQFC